MTISADEAKALLDAASSMRVAPLAVMTTHECYGELSPPPGQVETWCIYDGDEDDPPIASGWFDKDDARLAAAAPDLAATVVELSERIDKVAFFHPTTHGKPCGICEALGRYDEAWTQGGEPK